jgi:hypothetical protein
MRRINWNPNSLEEVIQEGAKEQNPERLYKAWVKNIKKKERTLHQEPRVLDRMVQLSVPCGQRDNVQQSEYDLKVGGYIEQLKMKIFIKQNF